MTAPNIPILTITQVTNAIKHCLESTFPHIWLQGEISNFKSQASGHFYFSLKDANAQISAVMFRTDAASLKLMPKDGTQVIVRGELNVYPPNGKYQIIVKELRPVGLGELLLKLEELKAKLHKKGWFNPEHKKPLPKFPKRIGVVTSPTGAAIQDILNVLNRRFSGFQLLLNPVRVQGDGAGQEIAQAIRQFNDYNLVDVMIVGRGGGSIEDLWAFNEEVVVEAIFNSRIPIISAVGHETDTCLSDYVADVRAPTPSAAAAMVIAEKEQQLQHLDQMRNRLGATARQLIRHDRQKLSGIAKQPLLATPYTLFRPWIQRTDHFRQDIESSVLLTIAKNKMRLDSIQKHLHALRPTTRILQYRRSLLEWEKAIRSTIDTKIRNFRLACNEQVKRKQLDQVWRRGQDLRKERLQSICAGLQSIDPKNLLKKGYSILFNEIDNSVITSVHMVEMHQDIRILLSDGEMQANIKNITRK